jgi:hypothetical protein
MHRAEVAIIVTLIVSTLVPSVSAAQQKQPHNAPETQSSAQQTPPNGAEHASSSSPPNAGSAGATGEEQQHVLVTVEHRSKQPDSSGGDWFRFVLNLLLPWPLLVILLLLYLFLPTSAPVRIEALLRPFQSLKLFGQEFVLNPQGGRNAEAAIDFYRKEVQAKLDTRVREMKLKAKHEQVVNNYVRKLIPDFSAREIRSTIHIPDSLFAETLYQLVDYYPDQLDPGRGRTFSTRFGIIGKAWRLAQPQYAPSVPTTQQDLILGWGMTQEEAQKAAQKDRQSFGCVIIKDFGGRCLGVFYMDSPVKDAFGNEDMWKKIENAILEGSRETKLTAALELIYRDFLAVGPRVHIYSSAHPRGLLLALDTQTRRIAPLKHRPEIPSAVCGHALETRYRASL